MRLLTLSIMLFLTACGSPVKRSAHPLKPEPTEILQGGQGTIRLRPDTNAFSHVVSHANDEDELAFRVGNGIFRKIWVAAPASTVASDGLGPHFDARGCQACHIKDGRGNRGDIGRLNDTHVLALMPANASLSLERHSKFGQQFQRRAIVGHSAEGRAELDYITEIVALADGKNITLKRPTLTLSEDIGEAFFTSRRIANPMIGLGLLEAIDPADILANIEISYTDNISGRAHWVALPNGEQKLGRFGWKAESPSLTHQIAKAFHLDMGLSSAANKTAFGDCVTRQTQCQSARHGDKDSFDEFEVSETMLDLVESYLSTLAVPARRAVNEPKVLRGKALFNEIGCTNCHTPKYITRTDAKSPLNAAQTIWPYTDMVLHDMGENLSDAPTSANPLAHEWRTPPLWGLGLTQVVNPHAGFLHDGRAETILEAVLWHGGEAQAARDRVVKLQTEDREDLLAFLESL